MNLGANIEIDNKPTEGVCRRGATCRKDVRILAYYFIFFWKNFLELLKFKSISTY